MGSRTTGVGGGGEGGSSVAEGDSFVLDAPVYNGEGGGVMISMVAVAFSKSGTMTSILAPCCSA